MVHALTEVGSFIRVHFQQSLHEVYGNVRNIWRVFHLPIRLRFVLSLDFPSLELIFIRSVSGQQLIGQDPYAPNIDTIVIDPSIFHFWRKIVQGAAKRSLHFIVVERRPPKVTNFYSLYEKLNTLN